jgi:hypothetical protein
LKSEKIKQKPEFGETRICSLALSRHGMGVMFMAGNRGEFEFKKNRVLGRSTSSKYSYTRLAGGKVIALGVVIRSETPASFGSGM